MQTVHHLAILCSTLLLFACSSSKTVLTQLERSPKGYVETYWQIAVKEMHRSGVPASITLAQGVLESRYGQSKLAKVANNHFGIKCHRGWTGRTFYQDDDAKDECFRRYTSVEESFVDHSNFLAMKNRYAFLFKLKITDYKGWAYGLRKAGYATNPKYPTLLIDLIHKYELNRYDHKSKDLNARKPEPNRSITTTDAVFQNNRIKTILVKPKDTPARIAARHNISMKRLLAYNEIKANASLMAGSFFYLQPKRRSAFTDNHVVARGEDMYGISQKYGIKLNALLVRNLIKPGRQPAVGELIYLKGKRLSSPKLASKARKSMASKITVSKGDTLYSIAKEHGLTVSVLKDLNDLESESINVGDTLKVR